MTEDLTMNPTIQSGNIVAWFETVGPERAKQLLSSYKVDYRKYRPTYAEGLARDMVGGHWNFDGSTVRIDDKGNLFDGQHRLNGVILSGEPQEFLFVAGIPTKAYDTTDTGLARTYGDTLRRRGFNNVSLRTALIKLIHRWESGKSLDDTRRMTNSELDAIGDKYVDSINRAVSMAASTTKKVAMPSAIWAFCWWLLSRLDNEQAYTFMVSVAEGEMMRSGMPAYTLRERLKNDVSSGISHSRNEYAHYVFQAWNNFIAGEKLDRVVLPKGRQVTRENMVTPNEPA